MVLSIFPGICVIPVLEGINMIFTVAVTTINQSFINQSSAIGLILESGTKTMTGSMAMTLIIILLFMMALCMLFMIPLEFGGIFILPYITACSAYYGVFWVPAIMFVIYFAGILARHFFFR